MTDPAPARLSGTASTALKHGFQSADEMAKAHCLAAGTQSSEWTIEVDSCSSEYWAGALERFEDATIYQTWAYGAERWGRSQLSHLILRRGEEIAGLAQLRIVRVPVLGWGIAYVRWGPLWRRKGVSPDGAALSRILGALKTEYAQKRGLLLRVIPHAWVGDEAASQAFREAGFSPGSAPGYRTFLLDLTPPLEQIRKNLDQKWRNQLNRAEKNNLEVREGTSPELYADFAAIYNDMMDRKAFDTSVDIKEFERIQSALPEPQKMPTFVACKDGKPVSALVGSAIGGTGIYLLGATSTEGMREKGSYLLQWRMIQRLKEHGARYYDLGGINPERNPGVYHFKSGFGAEERFQLGQFELSSNPLSSWFIRLAERRRRA